jgi:hypothetical protein
MKLKRYKQFFIKEEKSYEKNYAKLNEPRLITKILDLLNSYNNSDQANIRRIEPKLMKYLGKDYDNYVTMFGKFNPAQNLSSAPEDYKRIRDQWYQYQLDLQNGQPSKFYRQV